MHLHIVCVDMKELTLKTNCLDVAVFCLNLMNKSFVLFTVDLKMKARLVVAG